ncbi:ATP synthase F1 subunit epsilon [Patescibacteria group bacterium]|nr:ATP synthase F1 subunit epsilon [Patescibacteria group bacterium]
MKLLLEVITPEKIVFKDEVDEIVIDTINGQIAILPNHINLITKLVPGEMKIIKGKTEQVLAATGGFLEITNNSATILADYAVRAQDIEIARAQEAQKRAEHAMKEKATDKDFRMAEAELQKALLQLKVAKRHRRNRTQAS